VRASIFFFFFPIFLFTENVSATPGIEASATCYRRAEYVRVLSVVVSELKLSNVQRHIFGAHFVELQPIYATGAAEPFAGLDFAFEALDVANLGAGIVGFELPIILGDPLNLESYPNLGRLAHAAR